MLEGHWNDSLLDSIDAVIEFARTMTWKGHVPVVALVREVNETGAGLLAPEMAALETLVQRLPALGKWFVTIPGAAPA